MTANPSTSPGLSTQAKLVCAVLAAVGAGLVLPIIMTGPAPEKITYVDQYGHKLDPRVGEELWRKQQADKERGSGKIDDRQQIDVGGNSNSLDRQGSYVLDGYSPTLPRRAPAFGSGSPSDSEYVRGYRRRDGTYVEGHYRSRRNATERDNWTTRGNHNPVTGTSGTRRARH